MHPNNKRGNDGISYKKDRRGTRQNSDQQAVDLCAAQSGVFQHYTLRSAHGHSAVGYYRFLGVALLALEAILLSTQLFTSDCSQATRLPPSRTLCGNWPEHSNRHKWLAEYGTISCTCGSMINFSKGV